MTLNFNETVRRDNGSLTDLKNFCKENGGDTTELEQDVSDLQTAVGDEDSGLVKDVNTLKTDVSSLENYLAGSGWTKYDSLEDDKLWANMTLNTSWGQTISDNHMFYDIGKEYCILVYLYAGTAQESHITTKNCLCGVILRHFSELDISLLKSLRPNNSNYMNNSIIFDSVPWNDGEGDYGDLIFTADTESWGEDSETEIGFEVIPKHVNESYDGLYCFIDLYERDAISTT